MRSDLIEAYVGVHEADLRRAHAVTFASSPEVQDFTQWAEGKVPAMIRAETPLERLDTFLQWHGILGFTRSIFAIANGEM
jgi:hypothetical protein